MMNFSTMGFPKSRARCRIANMTRFIAVLLFFLLAVTAIIIAAAKNNAGETVYPTSAAVTPVVITTPEPTPEVPVGKTMEPVLIVIDAGHGGKDPGTISPYEEGFFEKDVTLYIARKVEELLKEKGIKVKLTREGEDHLNDNIEKDLLARAEIANSNNASLFVSIHVNAYDLKYKGAASANGMEVYYLNKDPIYTDFTDERFAEIVGNEISKATGIKFNGIISRSLSVLRNTKMPAILVETAYITNKEDHARLKSTEFRDKTAQGIVEGIELALQEINAFEYQGEMYVFKEVDGL